MLVSFTNESITGCIFTDLFRVYVFDHVGNAFSSRSKPLNSIASVPIKDSISACVVGPPLCAIVRWAVDGWDKILHQQTARLESWLFLDSYSSPRFLLAIDAAQPIETVNWLSTLKTECLKAVCVTVSSRGIHTPWAELIRYGSEKNYR